VKQLLRSPLVRIAFLVAVAAGVGILFWQRGPDWGRVGDAFTLVRWEWVVAAIGLNLLSVVSRAVAWRAVIGQALAPPQPGFLLVFSAFSVGLLANAVLPGRVGELARVAVLTRKLPGRKGAWATLVGSVFAHRVFDLVPSLLLVGAVLLTARLPRWAVTSLTVFACVAVGLVLLGLLTARRHHHAARRLDGLGPVRRLLTMARFGLGVMRAPVPATIALLFQCLGWLCQLLAVWAAMHAFHIYRPLEVAALVLVLMNIATILPLWPGNVGLLQAAIALPLVDYGISYARGFAFGIGLQAIEASVGVGIGLVFLAREGLSFAMLRVMPGAAQAEVPESEPVAGAAESERARARVPG
jgi:uncharacterized membrane protein YbhN (UPF0104 family)